MRHLLVASAVVTSALLFAPDRASAGGLEYTGQGAQALARGGAVTAKAEDPMVLAHNPAGLAELRGSQFLLNMNLALMDACVEPAGYYGWGAYNGGKPSELPDPETGEPVPLQLGKIENGVAVERDYYLEPYDTVCLNQNITPIPQIIWTRRLNEMFGIGIGVVFPSITPNGSWGGRNGVIRKPNGELRPAATRYMMLSSSNLGIFPNIGLGFRPFDALRIGAAFEWGIIAVNNFVIAGALGGLSPHTDLVAHIKAQDWFMPAVTASVHIVPVDALDIVLGFRWQDDMNAKGDIDITTGLFDPLFRNKTNGQIPVVSITQPFPWKLRAGIRYADRFAPRPGGTGRDEADPAFDEVIHDPLQDERWDIEFDAEYQLNGRVDKQVVTYGPNNLLEFLPNDPNATPGAPIVFPNNTGDPTTVIEKYWKDQISLRLGGTYNILPGFFAVSAGAHYENRGVDASYMQIDFWPVERIGVHGGVMFRVHKAIDLVFSYAHMFQETIVVAPPAHMSRMAIYQERAMTGQINGIDKTVLPPLDRLGTGTMVLEEQSQGTPDATAKLDQNLNRVAENEPPWIVNAGKYSSDINVLAVGVNVHF